VHIRRTLLSMMTALQESAQAGWHSIGSVAAGVSA
jgi:hypothetical protein